MTIQWRNAGNIPSQRWCANCGNCVGNRIERYESEDLEVDGFRMLVCPKCYFKEVLNEPGPVRPPPPAA